MLDCTATSENGPFITFWFFNNEQLNDSQHVTIDNARLYLNNVQLNTTGEYRYLNTLHSSLT